MNCKSILRSEMIKRRKAEGTIDAGRKIAENISKLEQFRNAKTVMIYMPILNEVDITVLTHFDKEFLTPVTEGDYMYACCMSDEMASGAFGVPEPCNKKEFDKSRIDIVIVPGVAFDKKFNRMGFGKGYYDRFLSDSASLKIGVCYDFQLMDEIESEEHDIKMDMIVTEDRVWSRESTLLA